MFGTENVELGSLRILQSVYYELKNRKKCRMTLQHLFLLEKNKDGANDFRMKSKQGYNPFRSLRSPLPSGPLHGLKTLDRGEREIPDKLKGCPEPKSPLSGFPGRSSEFKS